MAKRTVIYSGRRFVDGALWAMFREYDPAVNAIIEQTSSYATGRGSLRASDFTVGGVYEFTTGTNEGSIVTSGEEAPRFLYRATGLQDTLDLIAKWEAQDAAAVVASEARAASKRAKEDGPLADALTTVRKAYFASPGPVRAAMLAYFIQQITLRT